MAIIVDVLFFAFLLFILMRDMRRGLFASLIGCSRLLITFATAFLFSSALGAFLDRMFVYDTVYGYVYDAVSRALETADGMLSVKEVEASLPLLLRAFGYFFGTDLTDVGTGGGAQDIAAFLTAPLSRGLSVALAFVILLLFAYFALRFLTPLVAALIKRLPLIRMLDTVGGLAFGVLHALFWAWVLAFFGGYVLEILHGAAKDIFPTVEETVLLRFFGDLSPLLLLSKLFYI